MTVSCALGACTDSSLPVDQGEEGDAIQPVEPGPSLTDSTVVALSIQPEMVELTIGDDTAEQIFVVEAVYSDQSRRDVTSSVRLILDDPSLGTMQGGRFAANAGGGRTTLRAVWLGMEAEATIKVFFSKTVVIDENGAIPTTVSNIFEEAPIDRTQEGPLVVYPLEGTLFPPNLEQMEVHFRPGASSQTLFRLVLNGPDAEVEVFTRCESLNTGCKVTLDTSLWGAVARSAAGRTPITLRVVSVDEDDSSRSVGVPITVEVSQTPVEGALYYWSTSERAIKRVDFGELSEPETFMASRTEATSDCVGCHALSPDGRRLTMSLGGQGVGYLAIVDVGSRSTILHPSEDTQEQFQSWAPDSSRFVAVHGDEDNDTSIRIRNGETGGIMQEIDIQTDVTHVDWSPAGDRLVFTKASRSSTAQRPVRGGIAYIERERETWSNRVTDLVPAEDGINQYTPTYAPGGEFLLYGRSACSSVEDIDGDECDGDSDPSSQIWAVDKDGLRPPISLTRLNERGPTDDSDQLANTFPRWAPFVDARYRTGQGQVMWVTFSSQRRFGLSDRRDNRLLWMAAIDPAAILRGEDGSFAPFVLPFQDMSTSNHLAQWTQKLVTEPRCMERGEICEGQINACCLGLVCESNTSEELVCVRDL
ncbi:MAG: WD40 repeat domain-containing protein [Myxococcales bacterium]|nr:WD40 repeat domain-containing protein [Myxococcales bacterium]